MPDDRSFRTEEHPEGWRQLLTEEQRRAVASALKLIREHPDYERNQQEIHATIQRLE